MIENWKLIVAVIVIIAVLIIISWIGRTIRRVKRKISRSINSGIVNTVNTAMRVSQQTALEKSRIQAEKELEAQRIEKLKVQAEADKVRAQAALEKEQRETLAAIKSHCPSCGAPNKGKLKECEFCHSMLV